MVQHALPRPITKAAEPFGLVRALSAQQYEGKQPPINQFNNAMDQFNGAHPYYTVTNAAPGAVTYTASSIR